MCYTLLDLSGIGQPDEIPYSVAFTPANHLAGLPLKLHREFTISDDAGKESKASKIIKTQFTLGQILCGVIWELAFLGGPAEREKALQETEIDDKPTSSRETK